MTTLIKNSVIHFAKVLRVYTVLALVGAGVVMVAQLSSSLGLVLDFHPIGLSLLIFLSALSLIFVVSKPAVKEFEITAILWIRAFKRIRAEWKAPAKSNNAPNGVNLKNSNTSSTGHESTGSANSL